MTSNLLLVMSLRLISLHTKNKRCHF